MSFGDDVSGREPRVECLKAAVIEEVLGEPAVPYLRVELEQDREIPECARDAVVVVSHLGETVREPFNRKFELFASEHSPTIVEGRPLPLFHFHHMPEMGACGKTGGMPHSRRHDEELVQRGDRGRWTDRAHVGRGARVGEGRCRPRRATRDASARRRTRGRPARAHDRGPRSARRRRSLLVSRTGDAGRGLLVHPARPQRLPHSPQLRARALPEPHRADPRGLGRRAAGETASRTRRDGLRAGRRWRRRRALRRHVAARGLSRRVRRRSERDPQARSPARPCGSGRGSTAERRARSSSSPRAIDGRPCSSTVATSARRCS